NAVLNTRRRRALACAGATAVLCGVMAPGALAGPLNAGGPVDLLTEHNVAIGNLADGSKLGDKIIAAGDFNGDGYQDVATAGWFINGNGPTRNQGGAVYVIFGKPNFGATVDLAAANSSNYVKIEGAVAGDHLGWSIAPAGDVNGDDMDDLLIGQPWADPGGKNAAGGARVVYGRASTSEIDLANDTQGFRIDGAADGDRAGFSVATGDVNGDGRRDFILGAIGTACRNGTFPLTCQGDAGGAYVVFGKADQGNVDLANLGSDGFRMNGESGDSRAGWAVTSADFNDDGKDDVAVSAIGALDASGTTYVVRGRTSTDAVNLGALGADGIRIDGEDGDQSGMALASGDVDGDRKPELVIGVPFHNPDGSLMAGSAYVLKGSSLTSNMSLANPGAGNFRIDGAKTQDGAGWSVAVSPDVNGDGISEVLLGAPGVDRPSGPNLKGEGPQESVGAAYVVYGSKTPSNVSLAALTGKGQLLMGGGGWRWADQAGWSVAGLGDLGANGVNVVAVGVPGYDTTGNQTNAAGTGRDKGRVYLLNGVTDPLAPTVTITSPIDGAKIPQGTPVKLEFSCDDDQTVASCTATDRGVEIANGDNLPTAPDQIGPHTVIVTAKDAAGNTTTASVTYDVVAVATGTASGTVPATLSLQLGSTNAGLGNLVPGIAAEYNATTTANVISTAGDAALSVTDPAGTGQLVNGAFTLPSPLQVRANTNPFQSLGANPLTLLTYSGPVSNDTVTLAFKQVIGANDALRTGTYSKTLTFTLSTTTP
ncbi:MAG TPA: hypothetical protein VFZ00_27690, partial [Solirubrobacter sp.]|nr:hypothetical protein [Solirubrobacter sp.]